MDGKIFIIVQESRRKINSRSGREVRAGEVNIYCTVR